MSSYLSPREAAEYAHLSRKAVQRLIASGRVSPVIVEGRVRIPREQLDAFRAGGNGDEPETALDDLDGETARPVPMADLVGLLRELQADAVSRAEAAARWQTRAEYLAQEVQALRAASPKALSEPGPGPTEPADLHREQELLELQRQVAELQRESVEHARQVEAKDAHIASLQVLLERQQATLAQLMDERDQALAHAHALRQALQAARVEPPPAQATAAASSAQREEREPPLPVPLDDTAWEAATGSRAATTRAALSPREELADVQEEPPPEPSPPPPDQGEHISAAGEHSRFDVAPHREETPTSVAPEAAAVPPDPRDIAVPLAEEQPAPTSDVPATDPAGAPLVPPSPPAQPEPPPEPSAPRRPWWSVF